MVNTEHSPVIDQ